MIIARGTLVKMLKIVKNETISHMEAQTHTIVLLTVRILITHLRYVGTKCVVAHLNDNLFILFHALDIPLLQSPKQPLKRLLWARWRPGRDSNPRHLVPKTSALIH
jgi:hypothetical protein